MLTAPSVAEAMAILEKEAHRSAWSSPTSGCPARAAWRCSPKIRERWPAIVRILITAYTDMDSAVAAVNAGAVYKYITKPADFPLLRQVLTEALRASRNDPPRCAGRNSAAAGRAAPGDAGRRGAARTAAAAPDHRFARGGPAEVATGILHNVGNVLNSMNVSAAVVNNTLAGIAHRQSAQGPGDARRTHRRSCHFHDHR